MYKFLVVFTKDHHQRTKLLNDKNHWTTVSFFFLKKKKDFPYKQFHSQLNSSNVINSFVSLNQFISISKSYLRQWLHLILALSLVLLVQPLEAQTVDVRVVNTEGVDLSAHSNVSLFPSIKWMKTKKKKINCEQEKWKRKQKH